MFGSICSGIEAASVAWLPLDWQCQFVAEIDPFCSALLKHYYPEVPNYGDFTTIRAAGPIDVLVGGTPCQSFSVAGQRAGLDDPRGNLTLEYLALARRLRPRWLVWENVPGVLSIDSGRTFGAVLGGLAELGYGFAYRVLDAQYFGVPQRRRRVFVVGCLGDWRRAAAVLFERHSLSGHPSPRREAGKGTARGFEIGPSGGGFCDVNPTLDARCKDGPIRNQLAGAVAMCLNGGGQRRFDAESETLIPCGCELAGTLKGRMRGETDDVLDTCVAFHENQRGELTVNDTAGSLKVSGGKPGHGYPAVAFGWNGDATPKYGTESAPTMRAEQGGEGYGVAQGMAVRRLTPRECERLQGFPDDYTLIPYRGKPAADGPRYRSLGNSMAVPVMRWIGARIMAVDTIFKESS